MESDNFANLLNVKVATVIAYFACAVVYLFIFVILFIRI